MASLVSQIFVVFVNRDLMGHLTGLESGGVTSNGTRPFLEKRDPFVQFWLLFHEHNHLVLSNSIRYKIKKERYL